MLLLILISMLLLPLSAFSEDSQMHFRGHQTVPSGIVAIPDGYGGVNYWHAQGGTDAYTAAIIGQALTEEFQRSRHAQTPRYTSPPLTVPNMIPDTSAIDREARDNIDRYLGVR